MEITNYFELLVLHRAIMEAKFQNSEASPEVIGSPFLANVANSLIESIIELEIKDGKANPRSKWQEWRTIEPDRREWNIIVERIKKISQWNSWDEEKKERTLNDLLSPFIVEESNRRILLNMIHSG